MKKATVGNSIKAAECLGKLRMENKSPGLVSRDFREGNLGEFVLGLNKERKEPEEKDKVKSGREHQGSP